MHVEIDLNLIKEYALNLGIALGLLLLVYLALLLIDLLTKRWKRRLLDLNLKSLKVFGLEIMNVGKQELIITTLVHALQVLLSLSFLYVSLVVILSEIPATEEIATSLVDWIFIPIQSFFNGFISYLPKLFTIVVTVLVARYMIKGVKYISSGVVEGNFHFPGFDPHSARTTAGIISFLIYVLTIIIILPNMPGYGSLAFNGIATFLGALITIGGSSVIANYMAGIVLTYMHAFDKGDWVEVDGISGQIIATGSFAIRLNSYKEEEINIPNSKVLSSAIRNFSGKRKQRMMIHTEVSIGYEVPWVKVNELLMEASKRTKLLKEEMKRLSCRKNWMIFTSYTSSMRFYWTQLKSHWLIPNYIPTFWIYSMKQELKSCLLTTGQSEMVLNLLLLIPIRVNHQLNLSLDQGLLPNSYSQSSS